MTKGTERRTTRLSVRVPESLKAALELEAERDRRTLADVVIIMLEGALARRATKGARRG
jgi:predicted HicB family RNase H-like nuclease